jgi:hypothetical protein
MLEAVGLEAIKKLGEHALTGAADVSVQSEMMRQLSQTEAFRVGELASGELKDIGALKGRETEAAADIRNEVMEKDPIEIQRTDANNKFTEEPRRPDGERLADRLNDQAVQEDVENIECPMQSDTVGQDGNELKEEKMFHGGAYKDLASKDGCQKHHMPADSTTDRDFGDGPSIQMETPDHRKTASCGSSREACEYRTNQEKLVAQGKEMEAFEMDVKDIQSKFGDKYNDAIAEAREYLSKLNT